MSLRPIMRPVAAVAILFFALAASPLQRDPAALAVIQSIERGKWQLKDVNGGVRTLCVARPVDLLNVAHGGARCTMVTRGAEGHIVTVTYTCPGHGQGTTTVSVETPRLVRIESSGIVDGAPFENEFEARKTGECR